MDVIYQSKNPGTKVSYGAGRNIYLYIYIYNIYIINI